MNRPLVQGHYCFYNGQTEAIPGVCRGIAATMEAFEQMRQIFSGNTDP